MSQLLNTIQYSQRGNDKEDSFKQLDSFEYSSGVIFLDHAQLALTIPSAVQKHAKLSFFLISDFQLFLEYDLALQKHLLESDTSTKFRKKVGPFLLKAVCNKQTNALWTTENLDYGIGIEYVVQKQDESDITVSSLHLPQPCDHYEPFSLMKTGLQISHE